VKYAIRIAPTTTWSGTSRVADAASGKTEPQGGGQVHELPVPSGELEVGAAGGGEGGVPLWGVVPRVGFIVTNLTLPSRAVVRFYNKRERRSSGSKRASRR